MERRSRDSVDVDAALAALDALPTERGAKIATLRAALGAHYRVVAKVARLAEEHLLYELASVLVAAYAKLLDKPLKSDPNCLAKKAIARALVALDHTDTGFYLAGLRYRQLEPVWGGTRDTAAELRGACGMGLVASGYPRALAELAPLLADAEADARLGAVRAVACGQPREAEILLRAKIAAGDSEPAVLGECFTGLLTVEPDESIAFIAAMLDHTDEAVAELAALALGESKLDAAVPPLKEVFERVLLGEGLRRAVLRAAAAHRSEAAFAWLLELAGDARPAVVEEIVEALTPYRLARERHGRLRSRLAERGDAALERLVAKLSPQSE